ncbi:ABC-type cobalt transport system, permease component CbiQ [Gottschalkia purinilytica]|uniref:ABC-type cobalt transport system, permease component CbiQ n=1 Tax=Gottschalkia purinilytica TaxID=1503 RepID=A0A0L0WE35_GOTPU|nr:energy-coupling factor transporter transmembrane component T [Gottschalkia purinilytica]KNF09742.1 ABC-type cobalt transport system, permease component CbiQ [Gottschalkia purinilytica]
MLDKEQNFILGLYPTTKLLFTLLMIVSVFLIPGYVYAYSTIIIYCIIAGMAGKLNEYIKLIFKTMLILVIVIFAMQAFFYPGTDVIWQWKFLSIKKEGIMYGLSLTSKIVAFAGSLMLFFRITDIKDFVISLEKMGLPPTAAYVVLSTLQIIPEMKKRSEVIMNAQKTRGVEIEGGVLTRAKAFIPTLGPLVLSAIAGTEERAITLESRAFSAPVEKTRLYEPKDSKVDRILRRVILLVLIILIVGRMIQWIL